MSESQKSFDSEQDQQNAQMEQQQMQIQQQQLQQQELDQEQVQSQNQSNISGSNIDQQNLGSQQGDEDEDEEEDDEENKLEDGDDDEQMQEEQEEQQDDLMVQYEQQEQQVLQQCMDSGKPWEDPDFPPDNRSLFKDPNTRPEWSNEIRKITWKRPKDISSNAKFMVENNPGNCDAKQGGFGESWFIGAVIIIATRGDLLEKLIVESSHFDLGFVTFQFYKNGQWKQVMVDTYLPYDEDSKQILFTYCANPQEFWIPLMEKAYSKLHGCYENICDGTIIDGLVDLSGGVSEGWNLNEPETSKMIENDQLWNMLMSYYNQKFFLGCVNNVEGKGTKNADTGTHGILENHHYGICDIRAFPKDGLKLIRIRNVWGSDGGWNGPFCDDSEEWDKHRNLREELKLNFKNKQNEGTWWMSYNDWFVHFNQLYICKVFPESWEQYSIDSKWQGKTLGGICPERMEFHQTDYNDHIPEYLQLDTDDKWFNNPQFRIKVTKETKLYISLMLEDKKLSKQEYVQTNFMVIQNKNRFNRIWERPNNQDIVIEGNQNGEIGPQREITKYITLKKFEGKNYGYYVVVPNIIVQGKDRKEQKRVFFLRIFASDPIDVIELPDTIEQYQEGTWSVSSGGRRRINGQANPYWCKNPQYFLNLKQPTHLKIILQKTGNLKKTKGIKAGLSICRFDAPKDQRTQQKEKTNNPKQKIKQGQAQGSNLARLVAQTQQQLEPPVLDLIERKLQIAYGEKFKESTYQNDESCALYFNWNPTEGPFVIIPSLGTKDIPASCSYKLTIFSNNPVELVKLQENQNACLIGQWSADGSDGGCHLNQTWNQNPKFVLKFNDYHQPAYLKITLAIAEWKKKEKIKGNDRSGKKEVVEQAPYNTVERMVGIYLIRNTGRPITKIEDVVQEPNFLPVNTLNEEFKLREVNPEGYFIMPSTYIPKIKGTFILSVTSDSEFTLEAQK